MIELNRIGSLDEGSFGWCGKFKRSSNNFFSSDLILSAYFIPLLTGLLI
jgi:hypothetical protein